MTEGPSSHLSLDNWALNHPSPPPALSHAQLLTSSPGPCAQWVLPKAVAGMCSIKKVQSPGSCAEPQESGPAA